MQGGVWVVEGVCVLWRYMEVVVKGGQWGRRGEGGGGGGGGFEILFWWMDLSDKKLDWK